MLVTEGLYRNSRSSKDFEIYFVSLFLSIFTFQFIWTKYLYLLDPYHALIYLMNCILLNYWQTTMTSLTLMSDYGMVGPADPAQLSKAIKGKNLSFFYLLIHDLFEWTYFSQI